MTTTETVVLTGATSGIGLEAAQRLSSKAATLVVHGPEPESEVGRVLDRIRAAGDADVHYVAGDFSEFAGLERFTEHVLDAFPRIDRLINNAGVPGSQERGSTVDGFERTLQVNYLSMVLINRNLLSAMTSGGRIVNVGSGTHRYVSLDLEDLAMDRGYEPTRAYYVSKLAVVTYSLWLAEAVTRRGVDVITVCPGLNDTDLVASMFGRIGAPASRGGRHVASAAFVPLSSGTYVQDGDIQVPSAEARDADLQSRLVEVTADMLGLRSLLGVESA